MFGLFLSFRVNPDHYIIYPTVQITLLPLNSVFLEQRIPNRKLTVYNLLLLHAA